MEMFSAVAILLALMLIVDYNWQVIMPGVNTRQGQGKATARRPERQSNLLFDRLGNGTHVEDRGDSTLIAHVLDRLSAANDEITNIFVEDEDHASGEVVDDQVAEKVAPAKSRSYTVDFSKAKARDSGVPEIIRNFDTDHDSLMVICDPETIDQHFSIRRTQSGVSVLCAGQSKIVAFPTMRGKAAIDMTLVDSATM